MSSFLWVETVLLFRLSVLGVTEGLLSQKEMGIIITERYGEYYHRKIWGLLSQNDMEVIITERYGDYYH